MKCNRCGECCKAQVCEPGVAVYETEQTPCPGLKLRGDKCSCELMEVVSAEYKFAFYLAMGVGMGCTNPTKIEYRKQELKHKRLEANRVKYERSQLKLW